MKTIYSTKLKIFQWNKNKKKLIQITPQKCQITHLGVIRLPRKVKKHCYNRILAEKKLAYFKRKFEGIVNFLIWQNQNQGFINQWLCSQGTSRLQTAYWKNLVLSL